MKKCQYCTACWPHKYIGAPSGQLDSQFSLYLVQYLFLPNGKMYPYYQCSHYLLLPVSTKAGMSGPQVTPTADDVFPKHGVEDLVFLTFLMYLINNRLKAKC